MKRLISVLFLTFITITTEAAPNGPRFTRRYDVTVGPYAYSMYQDTELRLESQVHMRKGLADLEREGRLQQAIYIRRMGGEIIEGKSGRITGLDFFFADGRLPPLVGLTRPFKMHDIPARSELNAEINAAMAFVYRGFEQELTRREIFTPEFIEKLKLEDAELDTTRLQYLMVTKSVLMNSDDINQFHGVVSLFDGQISSILEGSYDLPVERKNPDYDLLQRSKYQDKVIEVRRLNLDTIELRLMTRIIGEHLLQVGKEDYFLYAHTDRSGMRAFRKYGFKKEMQFADGTFLVGVPARTFIAKVVPARFAQKYYDMNCDDLMVERLDE